MQKERQQIGSKFPTIHHEQPSSRSNVYKGEIIQYSINLETKRKC